MCAECHGPDGNSTTPLKPKLAGQRAAYLEVQLRDFRTRERGHAVMSGVATALDEQAIVDLAAWFSSRLRTAEEGDPRVALLGQQLFFDGRPDEDLPACATCHGAQGEGRDGLLPGGFPAIAAQRQDYTAAQLHAFRAGDRVNSKTMGHVTTALSNEDIAAVSEYVASLAPALVVQQETVREP